MLASLLLFVPFSPTSRYRHSLPGGKFTHGKEGRKTPPNGRKTPNTNLDTVKHAASKSRAVAALAWSLRSFNFLAKASYTLKFVKLGSWKTSDLIIGNFWSSLNKTKFSLRRIWEQKIEKHDASYHKKNWQDPSSHRPEANECRAVCRFLQSFWPISRIRATAPKARDDWNWRQSVKAILWSTYVTDTKESKLTQSSSPLEKFRAVFPKEAFSEDSYSSPS